MNKPNPKDHILLRCLVVLAIIVGLSHTFFLGVYIYVLTHKSQNFLEPGSQFAKFRPYIKGKNSIGYITNKDLSDGAYLQAQYYLAPTILDLHEPDDELNIMDSLDVPYIIYTLKRLNSLSIESNEYGQALIKRRR